MRYVMVSIVLSLALQPCCAERPEFEGWHGYTNEKYGYSLRYPPSFDVHATGPSCARDGRTLRVRKVAHSAPTPVLDIDLTEPESKHQAWTESRHPAYSRRSQRIEIGRMPGTVWEIWHEPSGELAWVIVDLGKATMTLALSAELRDYRGSDWWQVISSFDMRAK
jgi:hypothetical protein